MFVLGVRHPDQICCAQKIMIFYDFDEKYFFWSIFDQDPLEFWVILASDPKIGGGPD